jgi:hypothetical protein
MGGSVDVQSEIGVGSEFIINIKTKCIFNNVEFNEGLEDIEEVKLDVLKKGVKEVQDNV